jgi:hypothetical protein
MTVAAPALDPQPSGAIISFFSHENQFPNRSPVPLLACPAVRPANATAALPSSAAHEQS